MNTTTPSAPANARSRFDAQLSKATALLFHIAARSHSLAEMFGVEHIPGDPMPSRGSTALTFFAVQRPWLDRHPKDSLTLTFNADKFASRLDACSDGQRHMILWILNVWNPGYARSQGWDFDFFKALGTLDQDNREAIRWWMQIPVWP